MSRSDDFEQVLFRIPPYEYVHVLDTNTNVSIVDSEVANFQPGLSCWLDRSPAISLDRLPSRDRITKRVNHRSDIPDDH